jgi:predicted dinucleotide-binding enzyme
LAVPFDEHGEVAKVLPSWKGKTVIDAMNTTSTLFIASAKAVHVYWNNCSPNSPHASIK